jgi:lactate permease
VAILHTIAGTLVPLIVVSVMTRFFGANRSWREGLAVWRFALFAAIAMTMPYLAAAWLLGPEFPSLFGGLFGLAIVVTAARHGVLVPTDTPPWDFAPKAAWPREWTGTIDITDQASRNGEMSMRRAWAPYAIVAILLLATRLQSLPFGAWLQAWTLRWPNIFDTSISASVQPLYLPGTVFIVASLLTFFLHRPERVAYARSWRRSIGVALSASTALIFTVPMVQVFINSAGGSAGFPQMPIALADGVAAVTGSAWHVFAPFVGGIGAAVAGSNTVSNMMLALIQFDMGARIGVDPMWSVALQAVGGADGILICVNKVVVSLSVVVIFGSEGTVISFTLIRFVYFAIVTGLVAYLFLL